MIGRLAYAHWASRLVIRSRIVGDRLGRRVRRLGLRAAAVSALAAHATVLACGLLMAFPILLARHPQADVMAKGTSVAAVARVTGASRPHMAFEPTGPTQADEGPTGAVEWVPAPASAAPAPPAVSIGGLAFAPPPGTGGVGVQAIYDVFGGSPGLAWALRVARCESHYNPLAVNVSSGASGLFQFMPSTWAAHFSGWSIWDPYAQARAALDFYNHGATNAWACK